MSSEMDLRFPYLESRSWHAFLLILKAVKYVKFKVLEVVKFVKFKILEVVKFVKCEVTLISN